MSSKTFIVWLDPGKTTGFACYDMERGTFRSEQYERDDLVRQLDALYPMVGLRMAVGWEKFIHTSGGSRTSSPEHADEAIGAVRGWSREHPVELLKPQPSSARKLGSAVMLRRLGWYKPGNGHANDAAQHLLADLLKRRPMPHEIRTKLFPGYTPQ